MGRKGSIIGAALAGIAQLSALVACCFPFHRRLVVAGPIPLFVFRFGLFSSYLSPGLNVISKVVTRVLGNDTSEAERERFKSYLQGEHSLFAMREYFCAATQTAGIRLIYGNLCEAYRAAFYGGLLTAVLILIAVITGTLGAVFLLYYMRWSMKGGYRRYAMWCFGSSSMLYITAAATYGYFANVFDSPLAGSAVAGLIVQTATDPGLYVGFWLLCVTCILSLLPLLLAGAYKHKGEEYLLDRKEERIFEAEQGHLLGAEAGSAPSYGYFQNPTPEPQHPSAPGSAIPGLQSTVVP